VTQAVYSPDGRYVATASQDHTARIFEADSGRELARLEHDEMLMSVAFSPDGEHLATGTADSEVRVFRWRGDDSVVVRPRQRDAFFGVPLAFSPDGSRLAVTGAEHGVQVLDWRRGKLLFSLRGHAAPVVNISFSADGRRIASADGNGSIRVWDAGQGRALLVSDRTPGRAAFASFSPDGQRLLAGGVELRIVELKSGEVVRALDGHLDATVSALYTRDGRRIVTMGQDQTVRVFDARSGEQLHVLHIEDGTYAEPSPDGKSILVTHATGNHAAIYPATVDALVAEGCEILRHQPEWPKIKAACP
jgi:WD40 repeat protein